MYKKVITLILACVLLCSMVLPVHASSVEMVGTYADKFELTSDGDSIFDIPIMNPGDKWENKVEIKNATGEKMEVRLSEVVNKIDDSMLYDVLEVKILVNGELLYEGPYNNIPQSKWIPLKNGETAIFEVFMEFPGECGNEYQAKRLDSEWKFEARLPEGAPEQPTTPPDDNPVPTGEARTYYITGMVCLGAFILFIILGKKDDDEDKKRKRR